MERYPSYKPSGVKWLGEIPSHWRLVKSKYLWKESFATSENGNEELLSVSQYDGITPAKGDSRSESLKGYKIVSENDLVINIMLAWMGGLGVSKYDGIVSPAYCVYKLTKDSNPKYLHYLYKTPLYLAEFARHSSGVIPSRWRMYTDDFGQVVSLLPPRKEQDAIVEYLDEKMAKIDAAIAQQQKMIDLLNERKQIIINRAVTKGLNPNAKMKDSGVEWIGEVPEGWNLIPLKAIISFINGYAFDSNDFKDEGEVKVIRISNIADGTIDYEGIAFVHQNQTLCPYLTKEGDLLIAMSGATTGKVGFDNIGGAYVNQRVGIIRSDFQKWVYYWLNTSYFKEYIYLSALGSAQPNISSKGIKNFRILFPSNEEYERIVENLELLCQKVDNAIESCKKQISLLQERKQIIINEVVTGKVKVG